LKQAIELFNRAIESKKENEGNELTFSNALFNLANCYTSVKNFDLSM